MSVLRFLVQGSEPDAYVVIFTKTDDKLTATCTCRAGQLRQHCKHRTQLLFGQVDGLVSGNESEVPKLAEWLKGTTLEHALSEIQDAERHLEEAQRNLATYKKRLSQVLNG